MVTLAIDRDHDDPVYAQVADQLRRFISSGSLKPGAPLPSVRQLAGDLGVSLNTIARAYRLLETEGFLSIRDRAGVTAAAPSGRVERSAQTKLLNQMRVTLTQLRQAGMSTDALRKALRREVDALDGSSQENRDD